MTTKFKWTCSKQECIPVGCVPFAAVAVCWDVCPGSVCLGRGICPLVGVCLGGGGCAGGICMGCVCSGGVSAPVHAGIQTPLLWTEFLTHACENITFLQLRLRTVINRMGQRFNEKPLPLSECSSLQLGAFKNILNSRKESSYENVYF